MAIQGFSSLLRVKFLVIFHRKCAKFVLKFLMLLTFLRKNICYYDLFIQINEFGPSRKCQWPAKNSWLKVAGIKFSGKIQVQIFSRDIWEIPIFEIFDNAKFPNLEYSLSYDTGNPFHFSSPIERRRSEHSIKGINSKGSCVHYIRL